MGQKTNGVGVLLFFMESQRDNCKIPDVRQLDKMCAQICTAASERELLEASKNRSLTSFSFLSFSFFLGLSEPLDIVFLERNKREKKTSLVGTGRFVFSIFLSTDSC